VDPLADPHRSEPGRDVLDAERFGQHGGEGVHVGLERRVGGGAGLGGVELHPHVAGQVGRGVDEFVGGRVGEHQAGQRWAGIVFGHAEQVGDQGKVDTAGAVQAHGDRIGGGLHALDLGAGGDHAAGHDRRGSGGLVGVVELFQRQDEGAERVAAEDPDRGRHDPALGLFPDGVDTAGRAQCVAVQRPIGREVLLVVPPQPGAGLSDLVGVVGGGRLQSQQRGCPVPQPEQRPQLPRGGLRHRQRLQRPAGDGGERVVGLDDDAAVPRLWR